MLKEKSSSLLLVDLLNEIDKGRQSNLEEGLSKLCFEVEIQNAEIAGLLL